MDESKENLLGRVKAALEVPDDAELQSVLEEAHAGEIGELFEFLWPEDRSRVLYALPSQVAAEVVITLDDAVRFDVVEEMQPKQISDFISELSPDDAVDILGEMTPEETEAILENMPDSVSHQLEELLEYGPDTAGGIMTTEVVTVPVKGLVRDGREVVRKARRRRDDTPFQDDLAEIYAVDQYGKPVGIIPIYKLVTYKGGVSLREAIDDVPVTIHATQDQEEVYHLFRKYDVATAPVVDPLGRLVGRITHDDVMDVAHEEHEEDMLHMGGTDPAELDTTSVLRAAMIRLKWLLPCMGGMILTASSMATFKPRFPDELFIVLAFFLPMIGAMGGNTGVQTSTVVVRGLAIGELASMRFWRTVIREGRIALTMAPVCGMCAWMLVTIASPILGYLDPQFAADPKYPPRVAIAVGFALPLAIMVATSMGIMLPFLFRRLKVDPAIAAGPLVTTANDVISVSLYLGVAMLIALG